MSDINDLREDIKELSILQAESSATLKAVATTVDKMNEVLITGNGQPSIVSRVARLEVKADKDEVAEIEAQGKKWKIIIGAISAAVVAIISAIAVII